MILQLQTEQISEYWERIKYAASAAMETDSIEYSNKLFMALLSETHQCWLIFDEAREVCAMGITCILEDKLTGLKSLHIEAFYSFHTINDELALEATKYVKDYAQRSGCSQIRTMTDNPRAARLLAVAGFYTGKQEWLLNV